MLFQSFADVLVQRAQDHGDRGYTFLVDGEQQEVFVSYAELHKKALAIANVLAARGLGHERVILLFPPGLEFIAALFSCFYAGAVAVPLAPPNPKRMQDELVRMTALTRDSGAKAVLTTQMFYSVFQTLPEVDPLFATLDFIVFEQALLEPLHSLQPASVQKDQLAFLQYTSGSTGQPKGVMVTHRNILENAALLQRACDHDDSSTVVSWLPMFHDFGLIGCAFQPLFLGSSCVIMSPLAFLQRPVRWLQAIARYRAHSSGAPNFAFELCVRKISEKECEGLDLGSWRNAPCAAEPIRKSTLQRFTDRFSRYGFRASAHWPCYGLAESTLLTTGGPPGRGMVAYDFSASALQKGYARLAQPGDVDSQTLVALGDTREGGEVAIVSPDKGERLPEGEVGEIWLCGPSVTAGYFGKPEETARTFHAQLADRPGQSYLRTGDLGFLFQGELFLTSRLKDLLIIRGRNYYPQDLEQTAESASDLVRAGCCAAFSIEVEEEERPALVVEVMAQVDADQAAAIGSAIRQAISERHGLVLRTICLVPPGSIPKTSSGKLQRSRCRADLLSGKLRPLWTWQQSAASFTESANEHASANTEAAADTKDQGQEKATPQPPRPIEAALSFLQDHVARLAQAAGIPFSAETPFVAYGLDSVKLVALTEAFSARLGQSLPATYFFEYPTLSAVHDALCTIPTASVPETTSTEPCEAIAIIGMACRWPGAVRSPQEYWQLLIDGKDAIEPFPATRWDVDSLYDPDPSVPGKTYCQHGGFLHDLDRFDAGFFGISPREAAQMEPQQRLVLEAAWEAIEHAHLAPGQLERSLTGVYLGAQGSDYHPRAADSASLAALDGYAGTGHAASVLSGRIAYVLHLGGPALTVDTACSSSLVALHLACEGLRRGDCDLALAGGVQVMNTPAAFVEFSRLRGLASDGRCKSFGAQADGTSWSEGCGILLIKRLTDARRDGNRVLAVITGTAINQDGRSQGLTAPSGPAQELVIRRALAQAKLTPADIDAVEAHGTGTKLGDPIEASALTAVFAKERSAERPVYLGSCKSNLGHTQAAAGIAGVMKMVLSLQHETLPKTLHASDPSHHIAWEHSGLRLLAEPQKWPAGQRIRRAGVSSFGMSGTNAHVIVEESKDTPFEAGLPTVRGAELVVLSGRSEAAVCAQAQRILHHVKENPTHALVDLANGLATTRSAMEYRIGLVVSSREALLQKLAAVSVPGPASAASQQVTRRLDGRAAKVVFVFPGQGAQWLGMGRTLLQDEPVFRDALVACDSAIAAESGFSVLEELAASEPCSRLDQIQIVQPVLFAIHVALAALLRSFGVRPDAVVGHSMGEVAAAHVAGALSLASAAAIVCRRSRLLRRLTGRGEMAQVELSVQQAEHAIRNHRAQVSVAVSNSPRSTVLAGEPAALAAVLAELESQGVFCRRVKVDVASHSPQMDELAQELVDALRDIRPQALAIPMYSTVTGEKLRGDELDAVYFQRNLRQPVQFAKVVQDLLADGHSLFVELSPHPLLCPAVEEMRKESQAAGLVVCVQRRGQDQRETLLASLSALWGHGVSLKWDALFPSSCRRIDLPTYPWQRERHWHSEVP